MIRTIVGRVELRYPGEAWVPASIGALVTPNTTISTGFDSSATILIADRGIIEVQAISRLTLKELTDSTEIISTELYLDFGRVDAEVYTQEDVEHDFTLRTTVSVASVRGTRFVGDGQNWKSTDGTVSISNNAGRSVTITVGESTIISGLSAPLPPRLIKEGETSVSPFTNPVDPEGDLLDLGGRQIDPTQTVVTITWL